MEASWRPVKERGPDRQYSRRVRCIPAHVWARAVSHCSLPALLLSWPPSVATGALSLCSAFFTRSTSATSAGTGHAFPGTQDVGIWGTNSPQLAGRPSGPATPSRFQTGVNEESAERAHGMLDACLRTRTPAPAHAARRRHTHRPPDLRRDIAVEAVDVDLEDVDRRQPGSFDKRHR